MLCIFGYANHSYFVYLSHLIEGSKICMIMIKHKALKIFAEERSQGAWNAGSSWVDIPIVHCKLMDHAFAVRHFSVGFVHFEFGWQTVA